MRTPHRLLASLAAAALTVTAVASPAAAEVKAITDPTGDSNKSPKAGDIGKVRVKHGPDKVRLTVRHAPGGRLTDFYDFWVDVDPENKGPELLVAASYDTEAASVYQVDSFGEYDGEKRCGRAATFEDKRVKAVFPRSCFDEPQRIRVATHTSSEEYPHDWAPGRHRFGPWVATG